MVNYKEEELSQYKVLVVPAMYSANETTVQRLRKYVENGGHLVMTYRSLFADEQIKIYADDQPHGMTDVIGATYDQFTNPKNVHLKGDGLDEAESEVMHWMELLEPAEADVWAWYSHQFFGEYAAVVHNSFGKGTATYIGCHMDNASLEVILKKVLKTAGILEKNVAFPIIRKAGMNDYGRQVIYYFNYSSDEVSFNYEEMNGTNLLTNEEVEKGQKIVLKPWDFIVIEEGEENS